MKINRKFYFTLLTLEDGRWSPQFGDYDRQVVKQEADDSYRGVKKQIIRTSPDQATINAVIALENEVLQRSA